VVANHYRIELVETIDLSGREPKVNCNNFSMLKDDSVGLQLRSSGHTGET